LHKVNFHLNIIQFHGLTKRESEYYSIKLIFKVNYF